MTDIHMSDELAERVAESVRHALRLVGHPENGVERDTEHEESAVS